MLSNAGIDKVYLASGSTDMRKSIDGLAAIVQQSFSLDPFSTNLFVFCNKRCDKLKILHRQLCYVLLILCFLLPDTYHLQCTGRLMGLTFFMIIFNYTVRILSRNLQIKQNISFN